MPADHVFHRVPGAPVAVAASGCTIRLADGREILDGTAGALSVSIGHGRAEVAGAIARQMGVVASTYAGYFETEALARGAARLAGVVPLDDARVFPVSGGSEANETAIKLARRYHLARGDADRHLVIARTGAYHGNTRGALDASHRAPLTVGYEPWLGQTVRVPMVNPYRDGMSGADHAAVLDEAIRAAGPERVAAFIAEPISGATLAAVVPPDDYWPAVAEVCRRHGVLLILDEVMTGFGRTGAWFAAEHWGLRPDILTSGKGASSGYWPLGVAVCTGEIHDAVMDDGGFAHGFTWSHHPVGAVVMETSIDIIEREGLVANAARQGERALAALRDALGDHRHVGDIRGRGLQLGVELVADRSTKAPFAREDRVVERIASAALRHGVTVLGSPTAATGSVGDAFLFGPPLVVGDDELDEMVRRVVAAVNDVV